MEGREFQAEGRKFETEDMKWGKAQYSGTGEEVHITESYGTWKTGGVA